MLLRNWVSAGRRALCVVLGAVVMAGLAGPVLADPIGPPQAGDPDTTLARGQSQRPLAQDLKPPDPDRPVTPPSGTPPSAAASTVQRGVTEICSSGPACRRMGQEARTGARGARQDPARAAAYFEVGCRLGDAEACSDLGFQTATGTGVAMDMVRARVLFDQACSAGSQLGCFNLSILLSGPRGGPPEQERAVALQDRACRLGHGGACWNRAFGLLQTQPPLGARYRLRACHLGVHRACMGIATDVANVRERARYPQRSLAENLAACARGSIRGCNEAGWTYSERSTPDSNPLRAVEMLQRGCDLGGGAACFNLGVVLVVDQWHPQAFIRARDAWWRACQLGKRDGCSLLAESWTSAAETGGPLDFAFAGRMWDWLCETGDGDACFEAARLRDEGVVAQGGPAREVLGLAQRGCELGSLWSCLVAARELDRRNDRTAALVLVRRACGQRHAASCLQWHDWLEGTSVFSHARRLTLLGRACRADPLDARACAVRPRQP